MPAAVDHLLRTLAAVSPQQRVLYRGATAEEPVTRSLVQLGFEVHAAVWSDDVARQVQASVAEAAGAAGTAYAAAAPAHALPYPEAHFGWVVTRVPHVDDAPAADMRALLEGLLEEARHHLQPGGWVFVLAEAAEGLSAEALDAAAAQVGLAQAEAPGEAGGFRHAIYRRVEATTPV